MLWLNGNQKLRASRTEGSKAGGARLRKVIGAAALFGAVAFLIGAVVLVADPCRDGLHASQTAKERADRIAADSRRHEASPPQRLPSLSTLGSLS